MSENREYGYALVSFEVQLPVEDFDSREEFEQSVLEAIAEDPSGGYFETVKFPDPEPSEYVVTTIKSDDPEGTTMTDRFESRRAAEKFVHAVNSLPNYAAYLEEAEE